jgi:hypothetical protein
MQDNAGWHDTNTGTSGYELKLSETAAKSKLKTEKQFLLEATELRVIIKQKSIRHKKVILISILLDSTQRLQNR